MPTSRHQSIVAFTWRALDAFVTPRELGTARFAPLPVRLWPGKFREPDLLFVLAGHASRIEALYWRAPDLVMEVISPGTRHLDEVTKVREYAEAGIPEYWLLDPEAETITILVLAGHVYQRHATVAVGDVARSLILPGFSLAASAAFGSGDAAR